MSSTSASSRGRGLGRVLVFYVLLAAVLVAGVRYSGLVQQAVSGGPAQIDSTQLAQLTGGQPPVGSVFDTSPWSNALLAGISMLAALAIMLPVTWVYILTRKLRGYHESVVHTLLILPVAVTGIVMIVQDNIAIGFALAGIVAAVRFRTTLEDTKDAVYVFLSIGVGVSCGVQAVGIALVLSIVFNGVVLVLWKTQFGNIYADRSASLSRGDVLAGPGSASAALRVGDPGVLEATDTEELEGIAARAVRMERHLREERSKKKLNRANQLIVVHAAEATAAQTFVDTVLDELATRYKLKEVGPGPKGVILEYIARLDGPGVQGAVYNRLLEEKGGAIAAAELRSLKGLKPQA